MSGYTWEHCVMCGKSEADYFLKTGLAMLMWHTEVGPMCEDCYLEYPEPTENNTEKLVRVAELVDAHG